MSENYKISRSNAANYAIMKLEPDCDGDLEWNAIGFVFFNEKINGKTAKQSSDAELISDFLSGSKNWSVRK